MSETGAMNQCRRFDCHCSYTKLREKIEREPAHPKFLETVWGAGYRFNV